MALPVPERSYMKFPAYVLAIGFFAAAATAASADITSSQVANLFKSQGYSDIQISTSGGQMTVEATQNGVQVKVVYDKATGKIITQTNTPVAAAAGGSSTSGGGFGTVSGTGATTGTNTGMTGGADDSSSHENHGMEENHSGSGSSDSSNGSHEPEP